MTISLNKISKSFGAKVLFEEVSLIFQPGHRYGLTGPNGAGKSTLLKIIKGEVEPDQGSITLPERVSILSQNIDSFRSMIVQDVVMSGNARLWTALQERDKLYEKEITDQVGLRLGELEETIADENGYYADNEIEQLLNGLRIPEKFYSQPMHALPLDLQFRVLLCRALFGNPHALLLDEPTNHLDLTSIDWLEKFFLDYQGSLIVVSHNRHFLNTVMTHIADVDYETVTLYPGNYDQMQTSKQTALTSETEEIRSREKKIAQIKEFVDRFAAGTRASQVRSRVKEIDRLKPKELRKSNIQRPHISFQRSEKASGKIVCKLSHVSKQYTDSVLKDLNLSIQIGDKIGIIGNNGAGKTTLIKLITERLTPDTGTVTKGHNVLQSYLPQDYADLLAGYENWTIFDWLREKKENIYDQDIRSALGKLLFKKEDAFKQISVLSGGETVRLLLANMVLEQHNFIILDEPNNHLDLEAVSVLGEAFHNYRGTAIIASHDRELINSFATRIVAFEKDSIHLFNGTLDEYLESK